MKDLSASLDKITKPIFKKRGFIENRIITDWSNITGGELATNSSPRKLVFQKDKTTDGTLHIEVYDSAIAMELTYMEPVLIEKIACYFGYKAVARLKIIQKPMSMRHASSKPENKIITLSNEQQQYLNSSLQDVEDEEMRNALKGLGTGVLNNYL